MLPQQWASTASYENSLKNYVKGGGGSMAVFKKRLADWDQWTIPSANQLCQLRGLCQVQLVFSCWQTTHVPHSISKGTSIGGVGQQVTAWQMLHGTNCSTAKKPGDIRRSFFQMHLNHIPQYGQSNYHGSNIGHCFCKPVLTLWLRHEVDVKWLNFHQKSLL